MGDSLAYERVMHVYRFYFRTRIKRETRPHPLFRIFHKLTSRHTPSQEPGTSSGAHIPNSLYQLTAHPLTSVEIPNTISCVTMDTDEAAGLNEEVELLDVLQHLQDQNQVSHHDSEETISTTNQAISNSLAVPIQEDLNTITTSSQADSGASFAPGQSTATNSSGTTTTGNSAAPESGSNGQVSFSNFPIGLNQTMASAETGSTVFLANDQAVATVYSGTTGTSNATASTSGNSHVGFYIGRQGVRYTPAAASAQRTRPHTEVDYRCGICTGDIVADEKAAVRKSLPSHLCTSLRLYN